PRRTAGFGSQRIEQEDALERLARHDEPRDAIEITARLILRIARTSRRQRLEVPAGAAGMTGAAPGVARARSGQDRLHLRLEDVVIELWRGRALGMQPQKQAGSEEQDGGRQEGPLHPQLLGIL